MNIKSDLLFIDSHVHIGRDIVRIKKQLHPQIQYPRDYLKKTKIAYEKLGVVIESAIIFPFPGSYDGYVYENKYISKICKSNSFFKQFLIVDPSRKTFKELLKKYKDVKGYKIHIPSWLSLIYSQKSTTENKNIIKEGMKKIMENIPEYPLLVHPWYQDPIEGKTPVVDIILDTKEVMGNDNPIIFAHCAMLDSLNRIKNSKNVYIDFSAIVFLLKEGPKIFKKFRSPLNLVNLCVEKIGVDRCIWGSDSPFNIGYDASGFIKEIDYLFKCGLSEKDINYIARNNIKRLLDE